MLFQQKKKNIAIFYQNFGSVPFIEDSSVESVNIKVVQNNISLKNPKSHGFIQCDIMYTEPNYCS